MNCKTACKITSGSMEDFLPYHLRCEYESHVSECPECADALEETREMLSDLRSLGARACPVDCWPALRDRIAEQPLVRYVGKYRAF